MLTRDKIEQYIAEHKACADVVYSYVIKHMNDDDISDYKLYVNIYDTHEAIRRMYERLLERFST